MKSSAKPSAAQPSGDAEDGEALGVAVGEDEVGDRDRGEDDQPAHRRRARLLVVVLGPVLADVLAELLLAQDLDELRAEEDRDQHRRHAGDQDLAAVDRRSSRPSTSASAPAGETHASLADPGRASASATRSRPTEREPLTRTTSPAPSSGATSSAAASASRPVVGRVVAGELADADQRVDPALAGVLADLRVEAGAVGPELAISPRTAIRRPPPRERRDGRARRASRPGWRCSSR